MRKRNVPREGRRMEVFTQEAIKATKEPGAVVYLRDGNYWLVHPQWKEHRHLGNNIYDTTRSLGKIEGTR